MAWSARVAGRWRWLLVVLPGVCLRAAGEESRFAMTHSRSDYVHWIDLYDANDHRIDPTLPEAAPYSPMFTCGRCHDYKAISVGHHFNAAMKGADPGRAGEPWIWTDTRTGTQLPLSFRGWKGTYDPRQLGISEWEFVLQLGRHLPGGGPGEPASAAEAAPSAAAKPAEAAKEPVPAKKAYPEKQPEAGAKTGEAANRWRLSGPLAIDCLMCHSRDRSYSPEAWWKQITDQNFAWAPAAAAGLAHVTGAVSGLPDNFDPAAADAAKRLPKTAYYQHRINAEKKVFLDIARRPPDHACYYCHTVRHVGPGASPEWTRDADVHLRAGMACSDCHRNGIEHHTVRGFEGEKCPTGESVVTLSCRGCHLGEEPLGGRLGAPRPLHKGLPLVHLEKMSCTSCHSGPPPGQEAMRVQTAMAHGLGLPSHTYSADMAPGIVEPVLMQDRGVLYPYRMMWPSFWGAIQGDRITPIHPEAANRVLRTTLRVRRGSTFAETMSQVPLTPEEKAQVLGQERAKVPEGQLTAAEKEKLEEGVKAKAPEAFRKKLAEALPKLKEAIPPRGGEPVFVSGGRAYRLSQAGGVEEFAHEAAKPYAWPLAHDVRPARASSGATGCFECHSPGAPYFEGLVSSIGQAPDKPITLAMYEVAGYEKLKLDAWNQSFRARTAFKWFGFFATGVVGLILLSYLLLGLNGLMGMIRRR